MNQYMFGPNFTEEDMKKLEEMEKRWNECPPVEEWVSKHTKVLRDKHGFTDKDMARLREAEARWAEAPPIENDPKYVNPPAGIYDTGYQQWIAAGMKVKKG